MPKLSASPILIDPVNSHRNFNDTGASMSDSEAILEKSRQRAQQSGLAYAGALLPVEAQTLRESAGAVIVDVRSRAELDFVGRIPGSVEIELKTYPGMKPNPNFLQQLKQAVPPDAKVMFICRSGARSHDAATAAKVAGYNSAFNVLEGFEGDRDAGGHRNTVGGWRAAGLPWIQS
jgi:rhodanese-related sulfurtransferase